MLKTIRLVAAILTVAFASPTAYAQDQRSNDAAPPACEGQKFVFMAGEAPHVTRVTLCSKKNATSDDLAKMFESAASTLSANLKLDPVRRDDLVAQIRAKASAIRPGTATSIPGLPPTTAIAGLALPKPPSSPAISGLTLPKPRRPVEAPVEYTSLPPLPPPLPAGKTAATALATRSTLSKPRLTIECMNDQDLGNPAPCSIIGRETQVIVRADDAVPAQTAMRFVRRGDERAEVELAQLTRGKSIRFPLPSEVCDGVASSRVEIQIVRRVRANSAGEVVDSIGPYLLHC